VNEGLRSVATVSMNRRAAVLATVTLQGACYNCISLYTGEDPNARDADSAL
jgi:hypothetical protein